MSLKKAYSRLHELAEGTKCAQIQEAVPRDGFEEESATRSKIGSVSREMMMTCVGANDLQ